MPGISIENIYKKKNFESNRLNQGDILKNISFFLKEKDKEINISLGYGIILTQDCDLLQDYNLRSCSTVSCDKNLMTILVCPAYNMESFLKGEHLGKSWNMEMFREKQKRKILNNDEYKRYHYLKENKEFLLPDLIIDFKHFFTIPTNIIYDNYAKDYICSLSEIFREHLSQRFTNFLGRIGLPTL